MKKFEKIDSFVKMSERDAMKFVGGDGGDQDTLSPSGGGLTAPLTTHPSGGGTDTGPADTAPAD